MEGVEKEKEERRKGGKKPRERVEGGGKKYPLFVLPSDAALAPRPTFGPETPAPPS